MTLGVGYALGSLFCAAFLDIVFRRYSVMERSRGLYVLISGAVWAALQSVTIVGTGTPLIIDFDTILLGALAGVIIALANLLFIESLGRINVGLASTIYRLNTVAVVALAVWLLGEALTADKAIGIALGVLAVVALYRPSDSGAVGATFRLFFGLAILASLLRASWGIVLKAGSLAAVDPQVMMLMSALGFVAVGAFYTRFLEGQLRLNGTSLLYCAVTGGLMFAVANLLMLAVQNGDASTVVPIANMSFVGSLALSVALRMERLSVRKGVAIVLAVMAILVLAGVIPGPV